MRISLRILAGSLAALIGCAALSAVAQVDDRMARPPTGARPGELVVFSGANFSGRSYYVTGARTNIDTPFAAQSLMTAPGERWRVCSNYGYRAPCVTASGSYGTMARLGVWTVRSAQPSGGPGGGGPGGGPGGPGGGHGGDFSGSGDPGPSLRGMASEFFRSPRDRGQRVLACRGGGSTANCAAETADRWCRARGYSASAHELLETVGRDVYLADVLCQRRAG